MIRRGRVEEAALLRDLAESTFRESFSHAMPAAVVDDLMVKRFTEARLRQELSDPELGFYVAEAEGAIVGYAVTRPGEAAVPLANPAWELSRIYLRHSHLGTGLGEGLMAACVDRAKGYGARAMWLKVLATNARAIAFYRRWGFAEVGREDMDLQGTVLPHLILATRWED